MPQCNDCGLIKAPEEMLVSTRDEFGRPRTYARQCKHCKYLKERAHAMKRVNPMDGLCYFSQMWLAKPLIRGIKNAKDRATKSQRKSARRDNRENQERV